MPYPRRNAIKSPAKQRRKRKTANSNKNSAQILIEKTCDFVKASEKCISLTCITKESKCDRMINKHENSTLTMIIDDNALNEDYIPLTCPETGKSKVGRKPSSSNVCDNAVSSSTGVLSETIIIDDDDGGDVDTINSVHESCDNKNNLINDSIEIIEENLSKKNCKRKRKCDDGIEIVASYNLKKPASKRAKITPSSSNSIVEDVKTCKSLRSSSKCDKSKSNDDDDADIEIIDSVDKSGGIEVLNEFSQTKKSFAENKSKRKKNRWDNGNTDNQRSVVTPFAYKDTGGSTNRNIAKYKSPLTSVVNSNPESNGTYSNAVGNNIYNPNNVEKTGLRPVVIDGSNVAYSHGGNSFFSTRGLQICVNYFLHRGHMVVTFVPLFRRSLVPESDKKILDDLQSKRILSFTPSRLLNGRRVSSYDDRFIVQCAAELGGVVVSTDNYRDLVQENEAWRETIERRLLMFTWVGDILMFPDDPCGRHGPRLEEFLRFPQ